jgi:hypothetical protein
MRAIEISMLVALIGGCAELLGAPPTTSELNDGDHDGIANELDNCPETANGDQADGNEDDEGDACELDTDRDGVYDDIDNCVDGFNPGQDDRYSDATGQPVADGVGDVCQAGTRYDFTGDHTSDLAVFRPADGAWIIRFTRVVNGVPFFDAPSTPVVFGGSTARPVVADYDGDRKADLAYVDGVTWHWMQSSVPGPTMFGTPAQPVLFSAPGAYLVPGDYDGDGKADPAVFDTATGTWSILRSLDGTIETFTHADAIGATPVAGDFDGDVRADFIAYVTAPGVASRWLRWSSANTETRDDVTFGQSGDVPITADTDGDRRLDPVVYRPNRGGCPTTDPFLCGDQTNLLSECCFLGPGLGAGVNFGVIGDYMALFDVNADRKSADAIAFRPHAGGTTTNAWFTKIGYRGPECTGSAQGDLIPIGASYVMPGGTGATSCQ